MGKQTCFNSNKSACSENCKTKVNDRKDPDEEWVIKKNILKTFEKNIVSDNGIAENLFESINSVLGKLITNLKLSITNLKIVYIEEGITGNLMKLG